MGLNVSQCVSLLGNLGYGFIMSLSIEMFPGLGLNCWTGLESVEDPARWKQCDLKRGFRTCYTKYDPRRFHVLIPPLVWPHCLLGDNLFIIKVVALHGPPPPTPPLMFGFSSVGQLAGRGCSSKEKLYREHCEVHEMDGLIEKFCYCSFNLCNTATRTNLSVSLSLSLYDSVTV